jgi:hypothetical protein
MKTGNKKIEYQVQLEDLERCFNFALGYHFGTGGGSYNRTTGQYRGLGEKFDSFSIGKLIEIGVASIIERFTKKKAILDFAIHGATNDPDIVEVGGPKGNRSPKLFIEIKNISPDDRWVGLTSEQFNTILGNKIVSKNPKKAFIIYASLVSEKDKLDADLLGVYLKTKIKNKFFNRFCSPRDLKVVVKYIVNAEELKERGTEFKQGSFMYETEIFKPVNNKTSKKILDPQNRGIYVPYKTSSNELPVIMRNNTGRPKEFGKFYYKGYLEVFVKQNRASKRMYVYCKTDVLVKNKILGIFRLRRGQIYECFFTTLGWNPLLKRNNLWIAQRNLINILPYKLEDRVKKIAEEI